LKLKYEKSFGGTCTAIFFRTKRELSQEGLAYMAGIGTSTMGIVERGEQSPSIQTLAKIANALNIDIHKLFIFDD
jgi:DNA-binding XRE family transcriptional regulator